MLVTEKRLKPLVVKSESVISRQNAPSSCMTRVAANWCTAAGGRALFLFSGRILQGILQFAKETARELTMNKLPGSAGRVISAR